MTTEEVTIQDLITRLEQVEEDLSVAGSQDNDTRQKIDAITARITESERAMTKWVEGLTKATRGQIDLEEESRKMAIATEQGMRQDLSERVDDGVREIYDGALTTIQKSIGRLEKSAINIGDTLGQTEHSEDRRHVKALPTAKGYRIEASVELYGSDNHIVAQELAKLVEECRRELKEPLEGQPPNQPSEGSEQTGDPQEAAF